MIHSITIHINYKLEFWMPAASAALEKSRLSDLPLTLTWRLSCPFISVRRAVHSSHLALVALTALSMALPPAALAHDEQSASAVKVRGSSAWSIHGMYKARAKALCSKTGSLCLTASRIFDASGRSAKSAHKEEILLLMKPVSSDKVSDREDAPLWGDDMLARLRIELLRFAVLQLRNRDLAEDVVQEALAAAFAARERFEQRASVKTWVFAILKNKIVDLMRDGWTKNRVDLIDAECDESDFDVLFKANDRWQRNEMPSAWVDPEQSFENQEFWIVFELCMTKLPETTARVFSMREFLGLEVGEICKELSITSSNCWVILHRARMHLRLCLQQRWFERDNADDVM